MKKSLLKSLFAGVLLFSGAAQAHTTSIGTHNAGTPGSVTLWLGSYHSNPGHLEGSMTLNGTTTAFNQTATSQPAALVNGVNNFYTSDSYNTNSGFVHDGPHRLSTRIWQGVTFTGLSAGTYTYTISGMNSAIWASYDNGQNNWTGTIEISGETAGVPEPSVLALMGLGLLGFGFTRRKMMTK